MAVGFFSAAVLAASPLFGKFAPRVTLALPLACCTTLALLGWLSLPAKRIGLLLWGAGVAGCILSGGGGGLFVAAGGILAALADGGRRSLLRTGGLVASTLIGVAIGGLWLFPETARSGEGVLRSALWAPVALVVQFPAGALSRAFGSFTNLWLRNLPWSIPATAAVVKMLFLRGGRRRNALVGGVDLALLVFATIVFVPLSLAGPGTLSAFLPVLPFAAIISAREVARWLARPGHDLAKRVWTLDHVTTALFCLFMLLVVATPVNIRRPVNDPIEDVAKMAARLTPGGERIGNFAQPYDAQCARMLFYGGRSLEKPLGSDREVAAALAANPRMIVLSSARDVASLRSAGGFPFDIKILYGAGDLVLFGAREPRSPDAP